MNEVLEQKEKIFFEIEKIEVEKLPELQGLKEKQFQIVRDNPFVEITDIKTYEEAKKARTALLTARTNIEKQDKLIVSKINSFKTRVKEISQSLISITQSHEEKQQLEVKRWEETKEQEKQEKIRLEEERKGKIKDAIDLIYKKELQKIEILSFETIDTLKIDWEQNLFKTNLSQFEEFELDFTEKLILLKNQFASKEQVLREKEVQRLESESLKAEREKIRQELESLAFEKARHEAELQAKEQKAKKIREAEEERLRQERQEIENEKIRLANIEAERIAKAEALHKELLETEQAAKQKAETETKAKEDAGRLQALKPEKEKIIDYLQSIRGSIPLPVIQDESLKKEFTTAIDQINEIISKSVSIIKNFK
ncbi:coiled-coil domain-containing protein [Chryseobacterium potabilaquae]|uniref:Uncharacterized protein n=1 Tax=Chryseobacterium potabilaquae TaxID=2675057 RepID=A0A6N4XB46_9FLAO|nr:hypothetical protein [Chryseobacterium potabilaquae]CAA7196845.1 hypothetical protein CHRY9293_02911 [Chryseobacterium potabilaquae]